MLRYYLMLLISFSCLANDMVITPPNIRYFGDNPNHSINDMFPKDIKAIENYLNSFHSLVSTFKQSNQKGEISHGKLFISKPGKIRCEYFNPTPVLLIMKNQKVIYYDKALDEVSYANSDINALKLLSTNNIAFSSLNIIEFEKETHFLKLGIQEYNKDLKQDIIIRFTFHYPKIELAQVGVLTEDSEIDMAFDKISYNQVLRQELFTFHRNYLQKHK